MQIDYVPLATTVLVLLSLSSVLQVLWIYIHVFCDFFYPTDRLEQQPVCIPRPPALEAKQCVHYLINWHKIEIRRQSALAGTKQ